MGKTIDTSELLYRMGKYAEIDVEQDTVEEAAAYSNIGTHKLREITDKDDKQLVLWVGSKRLIKRKALEKYIDQSYSI